MIRKLIIFFFLCLTVLSFNWLYQIVNKPVYVAAFFNGGFDKNVDGTWRTYENLFKEYATKDITAEFLAGLAHIESKGDSFAVSGWRFRITSNLLKIYSPASSAVGLMQYTKDTFKDARRFCFENGAVTANLNSDSRKCKFNRFYSREIPSSVIEMTSARLHYYSNQLVEKYHIKATVAEKQKLASVIHLCGKRKGRDFVKMHFDFKKIGKCGAHQPHFFYQQIKRIQDSLKTSHSL